MTVHQLIEDLKKFTARERTVKVVVLQGRGEPVHVNVDHIRLGPDDVLLHLEAPK